ncbi:polysaccharide biosynthesis tyrosine autokinase [Cereibacter sphaeroides]|uniref:polysaccharide biosynthesis tyrosine autokinase n=2 Tax=Cereibacter sphaeroides TaxID=1063 RepID=UPI001F1D51D5|nr:polysaccharide biosynthesis tyrosine autokinase [Cereibacter sphaeroides]MCE6949753.1 polysaccharide biosynthesis tyrosine autokinase [Cereibacter sphaeroides]
MTADALRGCPDDEEIDLGRLLAELWAGRLRIAGVTLAAGLLALVHLANTPPTYRAEALLQLEEEGAARALPEGLSDLAGEAPRLATEIEILRSHRVLGAAVAAAHLDWHAVPLRAPLLGPAVAAGGLVLPDLEALRAYDRGDARIRLERLEVPPGWIGAEIRLTATGEGRFTLVLPDGSVTEGEVGVPLALPKLGFGLRIGALEGAPGRQFVLRRQDAVGAADALRGRLSVAERGRDSSILEVSLTGSDPAELPRTLGAIAEAYLQQDRSRSAAEAQSGLDFIERQLPEAQDAVAAAEDRLNAYRRAQRAIDLGFEGQSLLTEIGTVETELRQLAAEEEDLASRYTPNHPAYRKLLSARARLEERLAALRRETTELPGTQREVLNLTRDLEVSQQVHLQLLNRVQELGVLASSTLGNVRLLDAPRLKPHPIAPRRGRVLALALLLGALGGAGLVLAGNRLHRGIRGPEELGGRGLPVLATVLIAPAVVRRRDDRRPLPILALTEPGSATLEGIRSLRTTLHVALSEAPSRAVAVTSPASGDGKSFIAVNLAVAAAEAGQRVCLVDADLRQGNLRRYFGISRGTSGLADHLAGRAAVEDVLRPGPVADLAILPTGRLPPNPSELLMRPAFGRLVAELDRRFDLVIFDTPPALAVTDPAVIGRAMGAMLAVLRHEVTETEEIDVLLQRLRGAGVSLAGVVLNAYRPRRRRDAYGYRYDRAGQARAGA